MLSPNATYAGKLLTECTQDELYNILSYKIMELLFCYRYMTPSQQKLVADRMHDIYAPGVCIKKAKPE